MVQSENFQKNINVEFTDKSLKPNEKTSVPSVSTLVQNPDCQQCLKKKFYYDNHLALENAHAPCDNAVSCALVGTNECSRTDIFPAHVQTGRILNFYYHIEASVMRRHRIQNACQKNGAKIGDLLFALPWKSKQYPLRDQCYCSRGSPGNENGPIGTSLRARMRSPGSSPRPRHDGAVQIKASTAA